MRVSVVLVVVSPYIWSTVTRAEVLARKSLKLAGPSSKLIIETELSKEESAVSLPRTSWIYCDRRWSGCLWTLLTEGSLTSAIANSSNRERSFSRLEQNALVFVE